MHTYLSLLKWLNVMSNLDKHHPWKFIEKFPWKSAKLDVILLEISLSCATLLSPQLHVPLSSLPESNKTTDRNSLFPLSHFVAWRYLWHQESGAVCFFSSWSVWQSLLAFPLQLSGFGSVWIKTPCFPGNHQSSLQTNLTNLPPSAILLPVLPLSNLKRKRHKHWLLSTAKHIGF